MERKYAKRAEEVQERKKIPMERLGEKTRKKDS